jgi:GNAT superfamily N-acetyltransferase
VLHIRHAEVSELDLIVDLLASLWDHLEQSSARIWRYTEDHKKRLIQEFESSIHNENNLTILAEIDGEVVGIAQGLVVHRTTHIPKTIGMISTLFVKEKHRRKGVGGQLMLKICRFFRSKQVEKAYLRYVVENVEGERFWQDLGFEPIIISAGSEISTIEQNLKKKSWFKHHTS